MDGIRCNILNRDVVNMKCVINFFPATKDDSGQILGGTVNRILIFFCYSQNIWKR